MAVAFAAKLRVAAAALGCSSRKEFCARLRSANPATHVDLDRLNKWMQGRSLPRAPSVYADLAAAIGTTRPGQWIAESSLEDFTAELAARTGVDIAGLVSLAEIEEWLERLDRKAGECPLTSNDSLRGPRKHGNLRRFCRILCLE